MPVQLIAVLAEAVSSLFLIVSLLPKSGREYSHTNSYIFAMTLILQYDHLTAGAWAACDPAI